MNFKSLTIWSIVSSFFIIVAAGHGIGCIGLFEVGVFFNFRFEDFTLSPTASYDKSLCAVGLFAFIGHLFLLSSLILKKETAIFWTKIIGLVFLWLCFYYLTHNFFDDTASQIGFFFGIPFLILSGKLIYRLFKTRFYIPID